MILQDIADDACDKKRAGGTLLAGSYQLAIEAGGRGGSSRRREVGGRCGRRYAPPAAPPPSPPASPDESKYPPLPSVPKSSVKVICTLRMYCRHHSGSKIRLENLKGKEQGEVGWTGAGAGDKLHVHPLHTQRVERRRGAERQRS